MKNLCLENYGVSKLETREMKTTNGGWWQVAVAVVLYVLSEWDDISAEFKDGSSGSQYSYETC